MCTLPVDRRTFLATSTAALAGAALGPLDAGQATGKKRLALAGTGSRGLRARGARTSSATTPIASSWWACSIAMDSVHGPRSASSARRPRSSTSSTRCSDRRRPDAVIIATVDATHAHYIVRALELGFDVITEKPMCTSEEQCQAILDAVGRTGRHVTVTFNARHAREAKKVKALLQEGAIGEVLAVDFHEYLDTSHGADYFRRWHRFRENSGYAALPQGVAPLRPGQLVARFRPGRGLRVRRPARVRAQPLFPRHELPPCPHKGDVRLRVGCHARSAQRRSSTWSASRRTGTCATAACWTSGSTSTTRCR